MNETPWNGGIETRIEFRVGWGGDSGRNREQVYERRGEIQSTNG